MTLQQEIRQFLLDAMHEVTEGTETQVTVPGASIGDLVITTPGWQATLKITNMRRTS